MDEECAGNLECFHRPQDDVSPVPGCVGAGVAGRDYCYAPQPNSLRPRIPECTAENPCGACYGGKTVQVARVFVFGQPYLNYCYWIQDCDDDSHCLPGLTCFMRGAGDLTPVYGCSGLGIAGLDYCYNASAVAAGDREDGAGNSTVTISTSPVAPTVTAPVAPSTPAPVAPTPAPVDPAVEDSRDEDFSSSDQAPLAASDVPCSATSPCDECVGDCQSDDSACEGDLLCFVRPDNDITMVPGCSGTGTGKSNKQISCRTNH